jgi:hypothetical protein
VGATSRILATLSLGWFSTTKVVSSVKGQKKMRTPTLSEAFAAAVAAALTSWAASAHADQLAISEPADVEVFESSLGFVPLDFILQNTGSPIFKVIDIFSISQVVTPDDPTGDITREVLTKGVVDPCFLADGTVAKSLKVSERCTVRSTYIVLDADPFDRNQRVDSAKWLGGISVSYSFEDETALHSEVSGGRIIIKDDPIPEPSTWAMMLAGFAALGAALRYSRRPPGRAHRSDAPAA